MENKMIGRRSTVDSRQRTVLVTVHTSPTLDIHPYTSHLTPHTQHLATSHQLT